MSTADPTLGVLLKAVILHVSQESHPGKSLHLCTVGPHSYRQHDPFTYTSECAR